MVTYETLFLGNARVILHRMFGVCKLLPTRKKIEGEANIAKALTVVKLKW